MVKDIKTFCHFKDCPNSITTPEQISGTFTCSEHSGSKLKDKELKLMHRELARLKK
jgi:hypothetical protein